MLNLEAMTISRPWRPAVLLAALVAAGCGGDDGPRIEARPVDRTQALRADALTVQVRGAGTGVAELTASAGGGAPVAGPARAAPGTEGRREVPLTAQGRARLADCDVTALSVRVAAGGATRTTSVPLTDGGPPCGRFFSAAAPWNHPVPDDAPLDPASGALVAELRRQVDANYAAGFGPDINVADYSTRVYTAAADQPRVDVELPPAKRFAGAPFRGVPLPPDARPAKGTDGHLVLWQPSTDTMWEFYGLARAGDGWRADWGGRIEDVSRSDGVFRPTADGVKYGATASGLALAGGLITPADVRRRRIDHGLAFSIPQARAGAWSAPAQRTDGVRASPAAIPEGARFRVDPALDLDSLDLPPLTRMMAEAAQRYGMILRDQSGAVTFYAQIPPRVPYGALDRLKRDQVSADVLRPFPWDHLQLLEMDVSP